MNDKNINKNSTQSGRSMIEMLGVLAIVGVLSVGGIAGYSKAMEKFKINKTIDEISHIVANVRTLYAQQTNYSGLDTYSTNILNMGILPDTIKTSASPYVSLTNSFNGSIYIDHYDIWGSSTGDEVFGILYRGLNKSACVALASYDWGDRNSTGLIGVAVGSGWVSNNNQFTADSNGSSFRAKGCYDYDGGNATQVTCLGQPIPISSSATACSCEGNECGIFLLYQ